QIAHVSSVKVPVLSPSSIPTIWEEIQDLTGPNLSSGFTGAAGLQGLLDTDRRSNVMLAGWKMYPV
ncbi:hypothetical protein, partial [Novacetimonas pomaceti]|uniref:hypothetical protein n=1 Tax=Novacetimonas pomaceti TaxID=2021998 RepID=UPI001EEFB219